jgi:hypothetical protein
VLPFRVERLGTSEIAGYRRLWPLSNQRTDFGESQVNARGSGGVYASGTVMRTLILCGLVAACAGAQSTTDPPPILQLVRKPTGGVGLSRPYGEAGAAVNVIGMAAITGLPETWLVEAHGSFASIEDLDRGLSSVPVRPGAPSDALQDDVLLPSRTMIALYRPGWSYRPAEVMRLWPRARYVRVSILRIRPGTEADFGELVRLRKATRESVNLDRPDLAYKVISGAPGGTFVFLSPLQSLRTFDEGVAALPVSAEGLAAARAKDGPKIELDSEISEEDLLFRIDPRISYVSDAFAESDPEFWRGKPTQ